MDEQIARVLSGEARWCVVEGDAMAVLTSLPDGCVDAVVTDPPSGIAFMGAEWDRSRGGRAQWCAWLAGILAAARAATRPGGRAFVWSLPRTSHWTGCAVEDAGWAIETTVAHLFGTGWPKGATQTKPAQETWWLARTGPSTPLNIEACRVGASKRVPGSVSRAQGFALPGRETGDEDGHNPNVGRYPPNLVLTHAPDCVRVVSAAEEWRCVEGCPVRVIGEQSGELTSGTLAPHHVDHGKAAGSLGAMRGRVIDREFGGDTGTAARFFPQFAWEAADFLYCPKPSRAERNAGTEDPGPRRKQGELPPGDAFGNSLRSGNTHPTVKPVALMRWLIRLITQPGAVVLDPFGGSGTTAVAALAEGRRVILVEREPEYAAIARSRCESAYADPRTLDAISPVRVAEPDFGPLFR